MSPAVRSLRAREIAARRDAAVLLIRSVAEAEDSADSSREPGSLRRAQQRSWGFSPPPAPCTVSR
jgi:hypothetical protein